MNINAITSMSLDSTIEVSKLFDYAKLHNQDYVFLTCNESLNDLFDISEESKRTGVVAKLGAKFPFRIGQNVVKLALYPRNDKGKKALNVLSTRYHKNQKRNLGLEGMKKVLKDMAVVIDTDGVNSKAVLETIKTLKTTIFEQNTDVLFVGLHETFSQDKKEKNLQIKAVVEEEKVRFVPFNEVKFLEEKELDSYNYLSEMKDLPLVDDIDNIMLTSEDVTELFDYLEMVDSTKDLAALLKANYIIEQEEIKMPSFPVPEDFQISQKFKEMFEDYIKVSSQKKVLSAAYLFHLVIKGIMEKYGKREDAIDRAFKELKVIIEKDFADYFLIVWDFTKYAKDNGIIIGPGRGSVAGSIVAYCLNITQACPLTYKLQFERFLNIFRKDMPDIDIDVSQKTRGKLIKYLRNKYGAQFVAHIVTRSNYGFKTIITNMLKKMRVSSEKVEAVMELKPEKFNTLEEFLTKKPEAKPLYQSSKDVRVLLEQGYALKDLPNTTSTHAAGIIISGVPLEEELPMMYDDEGNLITQIPNDTELNSLEKMGYLKFDILGLRNLDIIQKAKELVEAKKGKKFPAISFSDEKALKIFKDANFMGGIFQFESDSAKKVLKEIGVENFMDIVIANAMNRPGPLDFVPYYAKRKGKPIRIVDEKGNEIQGKGLEELYPVLEETNGFIIFQEQINEIVRLWAKMDLAEAELFRKAISKKNQELLEREGRRFIESALKVGRDKEATEAILKIILRFANYGFNKSHSVVYSMISFELAYLKAYFPMEFFAALLTSVAGDKKVSEYVAEARTMGITVLPPDVNASTDEFLVEGDAIRCALQMVASVGAKTARAIVEARGNAPYKHIFDFMKRAKVNVDKGNREALAKVGAFDSIGQRHQVIGHLEGVENPQPLTAGEKVVLEAQGCSVIFSLSEENRTKLEKAVSVKSNYVAGVVKSITPTKDKYKRDMAKVNLITLDGAASNLVIFNKLWKEVSNSLKAGDFVLSEIDKNIINRVKTIQL